MTVLSVGTLISGLSGVVRARLAMRTRFIPDKRCRLLEMLVALVLFFLFVLFLLFWLALYVSGLLPQVRINAAI